MEDEPSADFALPGYDVQGNDFLKLGDVSEPDGGEPEKHGPEGHCHSA